jgi:hypothetical protein
MECCLPVGLVLGVIFLLALFRKPLGRMVREHDPNDPS